MANYKTIDDNKHVQEESTIKVEKCIYGEECICIKLFKEIKCKKKCEKRKQH